MTRKGRTYGCMELVLDPDIASGKRHPSGIDRFGYYETGADYIELGRQVISALNGAWVIDSHYLWSYPGGGRRMVGATHDEVNEVILDTTQSWGLQRRLYVSDRPFGFVAASEIDYTSGDYLGRLAGDMHLDYARQIWKGELGRGVPIPRLDYVRQPFGPDEKPNMKARERRRGRHGWVKLTDLGEMTVGYHPDKQVELILGYWQYSGHHRWLNGGRFGNFVDVAWGSSLDIELGQAEFASLDRTHFIKRCSDTSELWVRRGFAYTILRLQALGVQPEVMQPA